MDIEQVIMVIFILFFPVILSFFIIAICILIDKWIDLVFYPFEILRDKIDNHRLQKDLLKDKEKKDSTKSKRMMNNNIRQEDKQKVLDYRCKHKRCRYCKYYFYPYVPYEVKLTSSVPPECYIKDKKIYPYFLGFKTLAGCMCKEFGVDGNRL